MNDPPVVQRIPNISLEPEGSGRFDLARYASDPEGDAITWSIEGGTGSLQASLSGTTLTVSAPVGVIGTTEITFAVRDANGGETTASVSVVVAP